MGVCALIFELLMVNGKAKSSGLWFVTEFIFLYKNNHYWAG
jgi:hypothetical protein